MATDSLDVRLTIGVAGREATATVVFTNPGPAEVLLWNVNACTGGQLENNLFEIYRGDQRVRYTGMLAKRGQPTLEEFIRLAPRQSVTSVVPLHSYYRFPGGGDYRACYTAFNPYPNRDGFFPLQSNEVRFRLED